jgi:ribosomal protein S18 acetylase RimI-like enzyme
MGVELPTIKKKIISSRNDNDIEDVKKFIESNPIGCENFRYYLKRDISVIQNHIFTCLYYNNENVVGYGHLDYEDGKIWLGIFVSDDSKSKGFGGMIMDDLLSKTDETIYLSVDKNNKIAQRLYKNKKFLIFKENDKNIIMIKNGRHVR